MLCIWMNVNQEVYCRKRDAVLKTKWEREEESKKIDKKEKQTLKQVGGKKETMSEDGPCGEKYDIVKAICVCICMYSECMYMPE